MSSQAGPDQFRQAFSEEAREILLDLETTLLELNERRDDTELVGRAFRSLHTIKGSGAMFGFDDLAGFTHNLENAFDAVRSGRLAVTADLVDLTLAALDHIRVLLENTQQSDIAGRERLLERLRTMTDVPSALFAESSVPSHAESAMAATCPETRAWKIHFAPGRQ